MFPLVLPFSYDFCVCYIQRNFLFLPTSLSLIYVHLPLPQNQFILCFIFLSCYSVHMNLILTNNWGLSFPSLVKESSGSYQCLLTNTVLKEIISPNYHLMFRLNPVVKLNNHHIQIISMLPLLESLPLSWVVGLVLDSYLCIVEIKKVVGSYENGNTIDEFWSKREG